MDNLNTAFCRHLLKTAQQRIRQSFPGLKVTSRAVIGCVGPTCGQYFVEIRAPGYPAFDNYYTADNVYHAKAEAWNAFYERFSDTRAAERVRLSESHG